jgi:hypothetical protein
MSELRPRKHRCLLYSTEGEHRESVISTVIHGFEKRQKIVYIYDAHAPDTVLGYLEPYSDTGIKSAIDNHQLLFYSSEETYMKSRAFNPDTMLELIQAETERALSEGYAGLLGIGEMTWASSGVPGVGKLVDYEARLNEFLMAKRCSLLCQYDTNCFEDKLLLAVLITHPAVMLGTEVYDNQYFIPPSKFFNQSLPSVVLTERLRQLRERKHLLNRLDKQDQAMKILRIPQSKEMICPDGRAWFIQGIPVGENNDEVVGIIEIFQGVFVLDGRQISVTASIGISIYPRNGTDADTLVRNADSARYHAKKAGRNTYQYAGS